MRKAIGLLLLAGLLPVLAAANDARPRTPPELYPGLFERVQLERVYEDGKTFVDAIPRLPPDQIIAEYRERQDDPGFDLRDFVTERFIPPGSVASGFAPDPGRSVSDHIDSLWPALVREPDAHVPGSSLLPLPHRYVVPGGRFREIYYWDSYFTMLGLEASGRHDLVADMVRDFAFLIDRYGRIPNGNRSYYLSRSQPPFFSHMVELLAARVGSDAYREFLPQLRREYDFWMAGADSLAPGEASLRVVRLPDGALLNRYWDDRQTPREESYREDVATARDSNRPAEDVYRNLRAAAESGWDFSSRWLADGRSLATIRTVELLPVDLNSLLYALEQTLSRAYRADEQAAASSQFAQRAQARREAMHRHLWEPHAGVFEDYDWTRQKRSGQLSAAALYPLFVGLATEQQARETAKAIERHLLAPDGLATTTIVTGQQWDAPNGWAPLQWIAIDGLNRYGHRSLAREIARRWIRENVAFYQASGRLVEKYDVSGDAAARGGEYPLQDGFGWTNGVLRRLLELYPMTEEEVAAEGAIP